MNSSFSEQYYAYRLYFVLITISLVRILNEIQEFHQKFLKIVSWSGVTFFTHLLFNRIFVFRRLRFSHDITFLSLYNSSFICCLDLFIFRNKHAKLEGSFA